MHQAGRPRALQGQGRGQEPRGDARARGLGALVLAAAAACGSEHPGAADAAPLPPPADAGPCAPVLGEPELALELVAEGLERPVHAVAPPGDPRLFVIEQKAGRVRIVQGGAVAARPFLELPGGFGNGMEQGFVGLAFHPRYADSGRLFVSYTRAGDNALVVDEWRVRADDPDRAEDAGKRLFELPQPANFHHAGRLAFGPDGYLYLGRGDGGPMHDPEAKAQDLALLDGKFLRVDVDREDPGLPYAIPPDNPFVDEPGARPEIWALGVRNPWGWAIDPATGHLFFGDVSLNTWEELSVIPAGASRDARNFGWPVVHGNACTTPGCDPSGFTAPLVEYPWATLERCAVVGGPVYRGCRMPGHHGRVFFTDFCAAFLRSFRWSALEPERPVAVLEHDAASGLLYNVSGIGVDGQGELIVIDWEEGALYRVVPAVPAASPAP